MSDTFLPPLPGGTDASKNGNAPEKRPDVPGAKSPRKLPLFCKTARVADAALQSVRAIPGASLFWPDIGEDKYIAGLDAADPEERSYALWALAICHDAYLRNENALVRWFWFLPRVHIQLAVWSRLDRLDYAKAVDILCSGFFPGRMIQFLEGELSSDREETGRSEAAMALLKWERFLPEFSRQNGLPPPMPLPVRTKTVLAGYASDENRVVRDAGCIFLFYSSVWQSDEAAWEKLFQSLDENIVQRRIRFAEDIIFENIIQNWERWPRGIQEKLVTRGWARFRQDRISFWRWFKVLDSVPDPADFGDFFAGLLAEMNSQDRDISRLSWEWLGKTRDPEKSVPLVTAMRTMAAELRACLDGDVALDRDDNAKLRFVLNLAVRKKDLSACPEAGDLAREAFQKLVKVKELSALSSVRDMLNRLGCVEEASRAQEIITEVFANIRY